MSARVVIVGAGFGGLEAARRLGKAPCRVVVIDRFNHHVFQPLLYQVATAALSPADISVPIRSVLRRQDNTEVILAEVTGVDWKNKRVLTNHGAYGYDWLLLATGARYQYFGHDEWMPLAPGLKTVPDATDIRRRILTAFEAAEREPIEAARREYLTFVLVGGGPTGVEMAGAIAELAHSTLKADFRRIDPRSARVILVEAAPRILLTFPESLSESAARDLGRLGVEIRTGAPVESITDRGVKAGGQWIPSRTVLWSAGVEATPVARWLEVEPERGGRVRVGPDLLVPGREGVFVIGDAAFCPGPGGKPLPGVAPVAKQQGKYVARWLQRRLAGLPPPEPFRYVDKGNLATIGRRSAVAEIRGLKVSGFPAWLLWVVVHIFYLIGFANRVLVMLQWIWNYVTFQRGARLIVPEKSGEGG